ncbi:MAG TPA: YkgJ family cysteine cluster protein [Candidatus Baltobacteraceae bacterium]|jgi:Fe-S-cluster containining protein|nr:YkgJ family cysteine cluster protein [Candidatus Baltobacteraceae bacterium]
MSETIDLITHQALRELRSFTRQTGQPTRLEQLDLAPMENIQNIEIDEEHITITYNQKITHHYNSKEITQREWTYKYNVDPEFVTAVAHVINLSRRHLRDLPQNVACPPGCAECCSGYEPFVNREDVQRIADHLGLSYEETLEEYVVQRPSADGFVVGWLRKVSDDVADACVFLKGGSSGKYYCGIYDARPHDCRAFTPIGCEDVDTSLSHKGKYVVGTPFMPRSKTRKSRTSRRRKT